MQQETSTMQPIAFKHASRTHSFRRLHPTPQRGSVLIQFAVFLSIIVLVLGVVDLGYSFYAKRDLQRIADLAAIEAVQGIDLPGNSTPCINAGTRSVEANWPAPISPTSKTVVCGEWNSKKYTAPRFFSANITPLNAAQVVLIGESPRFIPGPWSRSIRAEAIAQRSIPTATFQVGSQLLNLNKDAPLGKLLTLIGLDANKLTVLDANGLANAKVSPSGLLKALGIDLGIDGLAALTPQQIALVSNLTLLQVLNASLDVISDDTLKADLRAAIDVIKDLKIEGVKLLDSKIPLLGDSSTGTPGIFTFLSLGKTTSPNGAALDAQVAVGAVLNTAIMIAANGHALEIKDTNILNVIKLGLTVVEPPTIASGPIGTMANSAQIRLNLDIDSKGLPVLGDLLDLLGLRIQLPIKIDSVSADATLTATYCPDPDRDNQPSIDLGVDSRVAKIIIGHPELSPTEPKNLLIKTPLSLNVRGPITTTVLATRNETMNLIDEESLWTKVNPLLLGDTLGALSDTIFKLLGGLFSPPSLGSSWQGGSLDGSAQQAQDAQIAMLAKAYLEKTQVNGFYNVPAVIDLMVKGSGTPGSEGYIGTLVKSDFLFDNAIPTSCFLVICPPDKWTQGHFSEAFKAYTTVPYGLLDALGISTLGNGYTSCAGLLTALLAGNACIEANLKNLLKKQIANVNMTDSNALVDSLKNPNSDSVTCSGALCVLLKPILNPIKWLLNGLGEALLSPLLTKVLGLELGRNEVKALDVKCNSAQLVY